MKKLLALLLTCTMVLGMTLNCYAANVTVIGKDKKEVTNSTNIANAEKVETQMKADPLIYYPMHYQLFNDSGTITQGDYEAFLSYIYSMGFTDEEGENNLYDYKLGNDTENFALKAFYLNKNGKVLFICSHNVKKNNKYLSSNYDAVAATPDAMYQFIKSLMEDVPAVKNFSDSIVYYTQTEDTEYANSTNLKCPLTREDYSNFVSKLHSAGFKDDVHDQYSEYGFSNNKYGMMLQFTRFNTIYITLWIYDNNRNDYFPFGRDFQITNVEGIEKFMQELK